MTKRFFAALGAGAMLACTAASAYAIGFVDSPSALCRKIKGNECAISWYYLSVNAAPNYVVFLRVFVGLPGVEQRLAYHASGFFQQSMYVPHEMIADAIKVPCGKSGTTPDPFPSPGPEAQLGNAYAYTVRARDTAGLTSANYGTVYCPAK